ncbi:MAG TPA: protoporphyrinogen oxidase [Fibrobacteria bacterium]|nr:protoporphyrinogen oxidase [Fibrobacteria bacterium]
MTLRVGIVGAGISGLSTHHFLEREAARTGVDIQVQTWDPRPAPGGNVRTESRDGWRCEEAAESILNSRTETKDLALELGLADRIVQASPLAKKRFLVWGGRLRAMGPGSVFGSFPTWAAKIQALKEPFVARGPVDETFAEFGRRRLGAGLFEQVMDPMVTGIYAADPENLSIRSAFPRIKAMEQEHGSLVRALWKGRKARTKLPKDRQAGSGSYSFRGGMTDLVNALAASLKGPVFGGEPLSRLERLESGWCLHGATRTAEVDRVVLALPSHQVGEIGGLPEGSLRDLRSIPYNPVAVVGLGFSRDQVEHPLDGFGFLVPRLERRKILGTLFTSSLWKDAAPAGHVLLRTMVGGGRNPELAGLPEDEMAEMVRHELSELLGARGQPVFTHVKRYVRGIPQYPVGHREVVERLRRDLSPLDLFIAGNAWDGIGVNDCVAASKERAAKILAGA